VDGGAGTRGTLAAPLMLAQRRQARENGRRLVIT
jgi:hypothetical protein